jgi:hypothetical protein
MERPFQLRCDAGTVGSFSATTERVCVTVSQRLLRDGEEQMWDCVVVHSTKEPDGSLRTRVLLCNPDWEEPLEVANVQSMSCEPASAGIVTHVGRQDGNL